MILANYFWHFDFFALFMMILAVVGMSAFLTGVAILIMFGLSMIPGDTFPESNYGDFEFANFDKVAFQNFVMRILIIFGGITITLHMLVFLIVNLEIRRHPTFWWFLQFVVETAGIAVGLYFLFKLDKVRLAIITAGCALLYLLLMAILHWGQWVII